MGDAVMNVDREVDKVLHKFKELRSHNDKCLTELISQIQNYQRDFLILSSKKCFKKSFKKCFKKCFLLRNAFIH